MKHPTKRYRQGLRRNVCSYPQQRQAGYQQSRHVRVKGLISLPLLPKLNQLACLSTSALSMEVSHSVYCYVSVHKILLPIIFMRKRFRLGPFIKKLFFMTIKPNSIVSDKPETLHCYLKLTISKLGPPSPIYSIDYGYG